MGGAFKNGGYWIFENNRSGFADDTGSSPIITAGAYQNFKVSAALLRHGADVAEVLNRLGMPVSGKILYSEMVAVTRKAGFGDDVAAFLEANLKDVDLDTVDEEEAMDNNPTKQLFVDAIVADDPKEARRLLTAHPEFKYGTASVPSAPKITLAELAAFLGRLEVLQLFHQQGAPLEKALGKAVERGQERVVKWMLTDAGLDLQVAQRRSSQPPLIHRAARIGNAEITRLLVAGGVDVNGVDAHGTTALRTVLMMGAPRMRTYVERTYSKAVKQLGLDGLVGGRVPENPVARFDAAGTLDVLLSAGADVKLKSEWGREG